MNDGHLLLDIILGAPLIIKKIKNKNNFQPMLFRRTIIIKKYVEEKAMPDTQFAKSVATSWAAEGEFLSPPQLDRAIKMNIMLRHYFERLGL